MVRTQLGAPDANGRQAAEQVPGSEHVIDADAVVMAFGFRPHRMDWLAAHDVQLDKQGRILAPEGSDNAFQTSNPKIFAGGDAVRGSDLVVTAIAEGRKAADGIMNYGSVNLPYHRRPGILPGLRLACHALSPLPSPHRLNAL